MQSSSPLIACSKLRVGVGGVGMFPALYLLLYFTVNILRNRKDAVIVQTSFWLPIVIVVIHTMVSENIDHQL